MPRFPHCFAKSLPHCGCWTNIELSWAHPKHPVGIWPFGYLNFWSALCPGVFLFLLLPSSYKVDAGTWTSNEE